MVKIQVNTTIDSEVVEQIDKMRGNLNRSKYIENALRLTTGMMFSKSKFEEVNKVAQSETSGDFIAAITMIVEASLELALKEFEEIKRVRKELGDFTNYYEQLTYAIGGVKYLLITSIEGIKENDVAKEILDKLDEIAKHVTVEKNEENIRLFKKEKKF